MPKPTNEKTIVLKNKFYPKGLAEIDIWNYYQDVKTKLINEISNRDIMLYIFTDINKFIIKRKVSSGNLKLNLSNFDDVITGRTVSVHTSLNRFEDLIILDIDTDNFNLAKIATLELYEYFIDNFPIVRKIEIVYTGKTSFHLRLLFKRQFNIESLNLLVSRFISNSPFSKKYLINKKRNKNMVNIDLGRNCFKCNHITPYSLSEFGLVCTKLDYKDVKGFTVNEKVKIR